MDKHKVLLVLGSNHNSEDNLNKIRLYLSDIFTELSYSEPIKTQAYGESIFKFLYLNQMVYAETDLALNDLNVRLKAIEKLLGRTAYLESIELIPADIDIICYDNMLVKPQDLEKDYVLQLCESFPLSSAFDILT